MIYITGDLHGQWDERKQFIKSLKKEDILICLGDFGWSWDKWHIEHFQTNCEVLSVLGNHENYTLIEQMPVVEKYGGKMRQMKDNVFYFINGEMYEIENKKFFVFGGALSIDKRWRVPYVSWWPQEQPTTNEYNHAVEVLKKHNWTFDYFLTHTAERELVWKVLGTQDTIIDSTENMILSLKYEIQNHEGSYKKHYFGHLHIPYNDGKNVCMYEDIFEVAE